MKTVEIPASVSTIGNNAFAGCAKLRLLIDEQNTYAITYAKNNSIAYTTFGMGSLAITTVVLKPEAAGVYFGSNLDWAAKNAQIVAYGIAVSTENPLPVADDSDETSLYTQGSTSVLVKDIMKTVNSDAQNHMNARKAIHARVYIKMADGTYAYSEAVTVTLQQVVMGAQNKWDELSTAQKDAMLQMYNTFESVMSSWNIPNLKNA